MVIRRFWPNILEYLGFRKAISLAIPPSTDEKEMEKQWHQRFMKMTDEELIECFNRGVGIRAFTRMRGVYLKCLSKELLVRKFNSDILFEFDEQWRVKSFKLSRKLKLTGNRLENWDG